MDLNQIRDRLDEERRRLAREGEVLDALPSVTRLRAADDSRHMVISSSLSADTAEATIIREIEHHRRLGVGFEWKLYAHDTPPDLLDLLKNHGFDVGPCEAVLVCDLSDPPKWVSDANTDSVRRVWKSPQVDAYRRATQAAFGGTYESTEHVAREFAQALRTGSSQLVGYVAYSANKPVSAGRLYTHPDSHFAGLYGGGTRPAYRGRGFYRALVAARARDAIRLGARYLLVDALPTSRPILKRLGFQWLTDTWPCEWRP